jgi:hypothetical protein
MDIKVYGRPGLIAGTCALAALLVASPPASSQNVKESFRGNAINMNGLTRTSTVDFTIERWSTDAEREQLLSILKQEKNEFQANQRLLAALQKMPKVGSIHTTQTLAWDLHYAFQSPLEEGGRRIVLGTDRPIGFREAGSSARTMDYPFTVIEMHLDRDDEGEGRILAGTKILVDKNNSLVLENYSTQPIRFNQIRKRN